MWFLAGLIMIGGGAALATAVAVALSMHEKERRGRSAEVEPQRDVHSIATSIIYAILRSGGMLEGEARLLLRRWRFMGAGTADIDIASWAEEFGRIAPPERRLWLLEEAVKAARYSGRDVPMAQYAALLDLSFALGFQTDALARLREKYPFRYVDPAKAGRPREADRGGGATPLFVREDERAASAAELGLPLAGITRAAVIGAYRKRVVEVHPDRFHDGSQEARDRAAEEFLRITRAYERLLATLGRD